MTKHDNQGFTLIELLIVIAIIGFLAAAILVAVDPVKRIQSARNAKRWAEVNGILNAILTKQVDDRAPYVGDDANLIIPDDGLTEIGAQVIVQAPSVSLNCAVPANRPACGVSLNLGAVDSCVADLKADPPADKTLIPTYLADIPVDPLGAGTVSPCLPTSGSCTGGTEGGLDIGTDNTGYYIHSFSSGRIEIGSCWPDQDAIISVKR